MPTGTYTFSQHTHMQDSELQDKHVTHVPPCDWAERMLCPPLLPYVCILLNEQQKIVILLVFVVVVLMQRLPCFCCPYFFISFVRTRRVPLCDKQSSEHENTRTSCREGTKTLIRKITCLSVLLLHSCFLSVLLTNKQETAVSFVFDVSFRDLIRVLHTFFRRTRMMMTHEKKSAVHVMRRKG